MTRQELCERLAECRKMSGLAMKDICIELYTMPVTIYRIESGKSNFNNKRLLAYLKAIDYGLHIYIKKQDYLILDSNYLLQVMIQLRKGFEISQNKLAESIGMSAAMIGFIETGKYGLMVDTMLKICDVLGAQISIEKL